jgi:hypothetical protein
MSLYTYSKAHALTKKKKTNIGYVYITACVYDVHDIGSVCKHILVIF